MVKITILGCGNQGVGLAGLLSKEADVETIVLADQDKSLASRGKELVNSLQDINPNATIQTQVVDANSIKDIYQIAQGSDVIVNAILPSCNIPVMKACIELKAHYLDLYSYPFPEKGIPEEQTIDAQLELDVQFKDNGITAFPCVGVNPGFTDLAAYYLMEGLDSVDSVILRDVDWLNSTKLVALVTPSIIFDVFLGEPYPMDIENGKPKKVGFLEAREVFEFPEPVGWEPIYPTTKPVSSHLIQRFSNKPIRLLSERFGLPSGGLETKDVLMKAISEQTADYIGNSEHDLFEIWGNAFIPGIDFKRVYDEGIIKDGAFVEVVEVTGEVNGEFVRRKLSYTCTLKEAMQYLPWAGSNVYATIGGVPIELVLMLARKEFTSPGVLTMANLLDYKGILNRIIKRGIGITENRHINSIGG